MNDMMTNLMNCPFGLAELHPWLQDALLYAQAHWSELLACFVLFCVLLWWFLFRRERTFLSLFRWIWVLTPFLPASVANICKKMPGRPRRPRRWSRLRNRRRSRRRAA